MSYLGFSIPADSWGTVSDWVMIIVTSVTAYFLYKTLKSQKEVQQTQNSLLKIEQLRVREDFKPNLKYSRQDIHINIGEPDKKVICIVVKNLSVSPALNVNSMQNSDINGKAKRVFFNQVLVH